MASNKASTALFIAMIFAVEVAMAHHFHHLPRDAISHGHGGVSTHHHFLHRHHTKPPCAGDSVRHFKLNGFDFKMEKGHEACYIACYKNVFVRESSPFTAEEMCHKKCSSGRVSLFSTSAISTATHTISSSAVTAITAAKKPAFPYTSAVTEMPVAFSSTSAAAEKPAVSSTDTAAKKPEVASAEAPAVSSTNTAAEAPAVSSVDTAAEAPGVWSAETEETNFGNPYS